MPLTEYASYREFNYILKKLSLLTIVFLFIHFNVFAIVQPSAKTDSIYNLYDNSSGDDRIAYIYQLIISGDIPYSTLLELKKEALSIYKQNPGINKANVSICVGAFHYINKSTDSAYYYLYNVAIDEENEIEPYILVDIYGYLGHLFIKKNNYEQATNWFGKMKTLIEKEDKLDNMGDYYFALGALAIKRHNFSLADEYFRLAEKEFVTEANYNKLVRTYYLLVVVNHQIGDSETVAKYVEKAVDYENQTSIYVRLGLYEQILNLMNYRLNGFDNEYVVLSKLLEYSNYLEDKLYMAAANVNVARYFMDKQNYDSTIAYLNIGLALCKQLFDNKNIAKCYHNLFLLHSEKNNLTDTGINSCKVAIAYADSAIDIYNTRKMTNVLMSLHIDLANYYSKQEKYLLADNHFDSVCLFIDTTKNIILLRNYYQYYPLHLEKKGDFENAYYQSQIFKTINDSVVHKENQSKIDELLIKFETEKKEKENLILTQSLYLEKEDNKTHKTYKWYAIYSGVVLFVMLLIISLIFFYKRREAANSLKLKNEKLLSLEKENMLIEEQKKSAMDKLESRRNLLDVSNKHLMQQAMLSSKLIGWLKSLKVVADKKTQTMIQSNLAEVKSYSLFNNWNTFEKNFAHVYPGVQESIRKAVPDLSVGDFRILCFMVMRLDNSEISMITMQSNGSLRSATYRLRNKFNVETNEELINKLDALTGGNIIKL